MSYYSFLAIFLGIIFGYFLFSNPDSNAQLEYGDSGLPKNCRAIIKENIDSYRSQKFSAEDILDSIDRNCGEFGYSWEK